MKDKRAQPYVMPDKHRAILTGALTLFARDGYTRASLDAIAATASVSTRTIYNHFKDKAQLFEAVIQHSSKQVAETQIAVIDRHLSKIVDLEADLIEFGIDWLAVTSSDAAPHFALVRQINAELEHIPQPAIDAWLQAGPLRVRRELADRLRRIADRGMLSVLDPDRAAAHLILLVSADHLAQHGAPRDEKELNAMVAAGVGTFLHGYQS